MTHKFALVIVITEMSNEKFLLLTDVADTKHADTLEVQLLMYLTENPPFLSERRRPPGKWLG